VCACVGVYLKKQKQMTSVFFINEHGKRETRENMAELVAW